MSTAVSIDTQLVKRDLMLLWFRISPDPTPDLLPSEKPLTGPLMCQARQAADRCSLPSGCWRWDLQLQH